MRRPSLHLNLVEDAPGADSLVHLVESTPLLEATTGTSADGEPYVRRARLIEGNVWGSSGFYSQGILESAATAGVFAAGTPMYIDHPTLTERTDRPGRSVRDLAGVLLTEGVYDTDGVYADVQIYGHYAPIIQEMADHIGLSIRAGGQVEAGQAAGRSGLVVSSIDHVASVDFVTEAGAGGKLVSLLESAVVNDRAITRGIEEATVNDRREALNTIVRDTYAADKTYVWLRDFDDTTVWFDIESGEDSGTWQQTYTTGETNLPDALTGDRTEVRPVTTYVPVDPAGRSTEESQEDTMPQIEEARLRTLEVAEGRVPELEAELTEARTMAEAAERRAALTEARTTAREHATTRVTEANGDLPSAAIARIVESAVAGLTLTDDNQLDEAALNTAIDAARTAEETYLAGLQESAGFGTVTGHGSRTGTGASSADADNARAAAFGRKTGA